MLERAVEVIDECKERRVILFTSFAGKDGIALLDLLAPRFEEVVCVFMYVVKDLEHIRQYQRWAKAKYPNIRILEVPHYCLGSYIKNGFLGCKRNPKQKEFTLEKLTQIARERTGITPVFFGFKQSDSMNRRLMLRGYRLEAISDKTQKYYPLSSYKNKDILAYIEEEGLKQPEHYGDEHQSSGADIASFAYLDYLRRNFPQDLAKIIAKFPMVETIIVRNENKK